jgi:hypothetical protein
MVRSKQFRIYQLGEGKTKEASGHWQVYFGLQKNPDYQKTLGFEHPELSSSDIALTGMVNNEMGAKGFGGPAVLTKAIEEGATVLDAFAVPTAKNPRGFLPRLYNSYGFEELGRVPFDPSKHSPRKVEDMKTYWRSTGWDESLGMPEVVIMKWRGDNAIRPGTSQRYLGSGGTGDWAEVHGFDTPTETSLQRLYDPPTQRPQGGGLVSDGRRDRGSVGDGDRTPLSPGVSGTLESLLNVTPQQASVFDLPLDRIQQARQKFPSLIR